ncbi:hypothetical protein PPL_06807 [Heterostelium album PN500]|uniref:AIG1-type G domain-containing protein n=1 Tax=Heterostelium pallidum (strain ATCC 26659 / Pp 5 / PN500) TaxID=670386 RepID=D3BDK5_HETP5|nr:hypothetical protein PPL_06807 [Heterostelium album PN500]EFA79986.1 hypothetical protein PPL_06807 [Heterostelium album PN500]|eukprot:XP_020432106.1 hypothetical protein PPL_06807 [Heterostelium album PN500]
MTTTSHSHEIDDTVVIDTPGLQDVKMREKSAQEIEKQLKKDKSFKIVYVITLESGRIKAHDLQTINSINRAIKTEFQYGIIINKVSKYLQQIIDATPDMLNICFDLLDKQPCKIFILNEIEELDDRDNALLKDMEVIKELYLFLDKVPASFLSKERVDKVDVRDYNKMVNDMESKIHSLIKESEMVKNNVCRLEEMDKSKGKDNQHHLTNEVNLPKIQEGNLCVSTFIDDAPVYLHRNHSPTNNKRSRFPKPHFIEQNCCLF